MGTTAEKLKYLNETKAEIKNALETPYNVMRDYPELIKKYIDNQPTKVVTDGICGNAVDVPVKTIETNGNIRQETTEGYNLLNIESKFKVTGLERIPISLPAGEYTIKADNIVTDSSSQTSFVISFKDSSKAIADVRITLSNHKLKFTLLRPATFADIYSGNSFNESQGVTTTYTNLMVYEGTSDKPYEPYTGGIPSPNPDYTQKITSVGGYDNIFDKNNIISGSYVSDSNGAFNANSTSKRTDYIEIQANSYYYIYSDKTSGNWGAWYDKDKKFISGIALGGQKEGTVNSPANAKYMAFTVSYQGNLTDYSNIKINETAIKIKQSGKNLLNVPAEYTVLSTKNNKEVPISLKANTKYTIKIGQINTDNSDVTKVLFRFRYNKADISNPYAYVKLSDLKLVYTPASDVDAVWIYSGNGYVESGKTNTTYKNLMIYEGTDDASYEPYHEPKITPINLQGNILSKVRDVKDILKINRNGEVEIKKNIEKIVLTGSEKLVEKSSSTTRTYWGIDFSNYGIYQYDDSTKTCDILTTKFKSRPQQGSFLPGQVALITGKKNVYFIFEPDTTEEQARAILTDMPVYFRLAEPQTIKLSSISPIELWQGTNIFKLITNLDTDFEVEYVVDKDSVTKEEE